MKSRANFVQISVCTAPPCTHPERMPRGEADEERFCTGGRRLERNPAAVRCAASHGIHHRGPLKPAALSFAACFQPLNLTIEIRQIVRHAG